MSAPRRGKRSKSEAPGRTPTVSDVAPAPDEGPSDAELAALSAAQTVEPETAESSEGEGGDTSASEPDDAKLEPISGAGEIDAAVATEADATDDEARSAKAEGDGEVGGDGEASAEEEVVATASAAPGPAGGLSRERLKTVLESLVFVSDHTVSAQQLARMVKVKLAVVRELLTELSEDYRERGIELVELAGGFQFRSAASSADWVREFVAQRPVRLTRAQLETLALIAYRQPITRPEIDEVRGVDSGSAVRVLLERDLIKMLGRKDEPGRPLLYGTTPHFLEFFGMRSLKDLPTLREFTELNEENRALFKRKTGEEVADAEAALAAAEEAARQDGEQAAHISDEDLAALAAQEDLAAAEEAASGWSEPPAAGAEPEAEHAPGEPMSDAEAAFEPDLEPDTEGNAADDAGELG